MKYIEIASADNDRHDATPSSHNWEIVAAGESYPALLASLLRAANSEHFDISDSWLRLVDDGIVATF